MMLDCEYKTTIDDGTVYRLNKCFGVTDADVDTGKTTCHIDWMLEPEARSWGIKSISVFATKIVASVEWEVSTDDLNDDEKNKLIAAGGKEYKSSESISGTIDVISNEEWNGKKWIVNSEFEIGEGGRCSPDDVEIDFESMTITIS